MQTKSLDEMTVDELRDRIVELEAYVHILEGQVNTWHVGDWFVTIGFPKKEYFYVKKLASEGIVAGCSDWDPSQSEYFTWDDLRSYGERILRIGSGQRKWYWRFLPWRNLVCPYHRPKGWV